MAIIDFLSRLFTTSKPTGNKTRRTPRRSGLTGEQRELAIREIQSSYGEVLGVVRSVRTHLTDQARRSDQMIGLLTEMAEAMKSIPESTRAQQVMVESLQEHLDRSADKDARIADALTDIATASDQQNQVMGAVQEQLTAGHEVDQQMLESVGHLRGTLTDLSSSSRQHSQAIEQMSERQSANESQLREMLDRGRRQMMYTTAASWMVAALALGALGVTGWGMLQQQTPVTYAQAPAPEHRHLTVAQQTPPATPRIEQSVSPEQATEVLWDAQPAMSPAQSVAGQQPAAPMTVKPVKLDTTVIGSPTFKPLLPSNASPVPIGSLMPVTTSVLDQSDQLGAYVKTFISQRFQQLPQPDLDRLLETMTRTPDREQENTTAP